MTSAKLMPTGAIAVEAIAPPSKKGSPHGWIEWKDHVRTTKKGVKTYPQPWLHWEPRYGCKRCAYIPNKKLIYVIQSLKRGRPLNETLAILGKAVG